MPKNIEIVERSSGFYVVDSTGVVETEAAVGGPFDTVEEAREWAEENVV
jgi:hypothetical protein